MVPTGYTIDQAMDYLRNEVLRNSADELGWGNLSDGAFRGEEIRTVTSNTTTVLTLTSGLVHAFPKGTGILFEDGSINVMANNEAVGSTAIELETAVTAAHYNGKKFIAQYQAEVVPVPNPKYVYVIDEALRQMGIEDIELINSTNIREFRLRARIELLRRINESRVPKFDYVENFGTNDPDLTEISHTPSDTTSQVTRLYNREVIRIGNELSQVDVDTTQVYINPSVPEESVSAGTQVAIRW